MRTANPVRYFSNRTWNACDVMFDQWPSSHVSSYITSSPVRSSQITKPRKYYPSYHCYALSTDLRYRSIMLRHLGICFGTTIDRQCHHRWIVLRYRWISTDQSFQVSGLAERSFWALGIVIVIEYWPWVTHCHRIVGLNR